MTERRMIVVSGAVVGALTLVATVALQRLPAGTQLPTQWNAAGEADRFGDAGYALFLPVVLAAATSALFAVLPRVEPLQDRMAGSRTLLDTSWASLLGLMVLIEAVVAAPAFGFGLPPRVVMAGIGVMLVVIGNALPKSRPGFFVGIRTPWAILDTDNWVATHRIGSRVMVAAGLSIVAAALLPLAPTTRAIIVAIAIGGMIVVPFGYSWLHWRRATAS